MRMGFLADTHLPNSIPHLWPEVKQVFQGVDLVLHGGDIVVPEVLDWLETIAPVVAVKGNNDYGWPDSRIRDVQVFTVEGWRIGLIHDIEPEDRPIPYLLHHYFRGEALDLMLSGHTHKERLDLRHGVLQVNPGSPTLPHNKSTRRGTVALLDITREQVSVRILRIGDGPLPNPGREMALTVHRDDLENIRQGFPNPR